jgi:hypothetical protein
MLATVWGLSKNNANHRPAPQADLRCNHCVYMFHHWRLVAVTWSAGSSAARLPATSSRPAADVRLGCQGRSSVTPILEPIVVRKCCSLAEVGA